MQVFFLRAPSLLIIQTGIIRSEASPFWSLAGSTTIQERGRGGMVNTVGKLITEGSLRLGEDVLDARGFGHLACMRGPTRV